MSSGRFMALILALPFSFLLFLLVISLPFISGSSSLCPSPSSCLVAHVSTNIPQQIDSVPFAYNFQRLSADLLILSDVAHINIAFENLSPGPAAVELLINCDIGDQQQSYSYNTVVSTDSWSALEIPLSLSYSSLYRQMFCCSAELSINASTASPTQFPCFFQDLDYVYELQWNATASWVSQQSRPQVHLIWTNPAGQSHSEPIFYYLTDSKLLDTNHTQLQYYNVVKMTDPWPIGWSSYENEFRSVSWQRQATKHFPMKTFNFTAHPTESFAVLLSPRLLSVTTIAGPNSTRNLRDQILPIVDQTSIVRIDSLFQLPDQLDQFDLVCAWTIRTLSSQPFPIALGPAISWQSGIGNNLTCDASVIEPLVAGQHIVPACLMVRFYPKLTTIQGMYQYVTLQQSLSLPCYAYIPQPGSAGLSKGAVAGIVIGCIAFVLLAAVVIYWHRRRSSAAERQPLLNGRSTVQSS